MRRGGSGALRRARPRSGPRGSFCLRQQQWHSPHCETHALGRADAPTTGRLERSGSRQTRGGSRHSTGVEGRRRRGVLASRAAESVGVSARRFTSGAKKRRFSFFLVENRNYRCMTLIYTRKRPFLALGSGDYSCLASAACGTCHTSSCAHSLSSPAFDTLRRTSCVTLSPPC